MRKETKAEKVVFLFLVVLCVISVYGVIGMWYGANVVNKNFEKEIRQFSEGSYVTENGKVVWKKWNRLCNAYSNENTKNYIKCANAEGSTEGVFDNEISRMKKMADEWNTQTGLFVFKFSAELRGEVEIYCASASYVALDLFWLKHWLGEKDERAEGKVAETK